MLPSSSTNHIKLKGSYDVAKLRDELEKVVKLGWNIQKPFSTDEVPELATTVYHDGSWKMISLRSLGGNREKTDPGGPSLVDYAYTDYIHGAPYIKSILDTFGSYVRTARLSVIAPGENIDTHSDTYIAFQYGHVRLHIPIITNDQVAMTIGGEDKYWDAGQLWYGDFSKPHSVVNNGSSPRIHLMFDVCINPMLMSLFPKFDSQEIPSNRILFHKDQITMEQKDLKKYECDLMISAGLINGAFEYDDGIPGEFDGRVSVYEEKLTLFLNDKPLYTLVPISTVEFRLLGWSMERTFLFQFSDDKVSAFYMHLNNGNIKTEINIPLKSFDKTQ